MPKHGYFVPDSKLEGELGEEVTRVLDKLLDLDCLAVQVTLISQQDGDNLKTLSRVACRGHVNGAVAIDYLLEAAQDYLAAIKTRLQEGGDISH